jgi:hypothetical protein
LACAIAWDLVIVLLPFLECAFQKTVEEAKSLISSAAETGNPREVYIKVLQGLSSLTWTLGKEEKEDQEDKEGLDENDENEGNEAKDREVKEDSYAGDGGNDELQSLTHKSNDCVQYANSATLKFTTLLSALQTVHPRISAKFPSKFLSTELSTLLIAFTRAVETVDGETVAGIVEQIISFLGVIQPQLANSEKISPTKRPPLPPRTSTAGSIPTYEHSSGQREVEEAEQKLQARLIVSFLSHILSAYLLQGRHESASQTKPGHEQSSILSLGNEDSIGFDVGWAGKYDEEFLRPNKHKVPNGQTLIDFEREMRNSQFYHKRNVDEISKICTKLGLDHLELFKLCEAGYGIFEYPLFLKFYFRRSF